MNMYRYICKHCGAYLDPGEKCECQDALSMRERIYENLFAIEHDEQMILKEVQECNA